ncbi:hypothetical protein pclt_cds_502 [Pandoravirus celtis]|uniref:Uncharacterized protein n=1 Tax=Pandoravirus celtis TaxID=2568002 RepID=A0A4D6EH35_9VIRU|nr:hypothetical protein pclt_cds_502 [Pandoravirus celtis]
MTLVLWSVWVGLRAADKATTPKHTPRDGALPDGTCPRLAHCFFLFFPFPFFPVFLFYFCWQPVACLVLLAQTRTIRCPAAGICASLKSHTTTVGALFSIMHRRYQRGHFFSTTA